jgi:hypothetical protein
LTGFGESILKSASKKKSKVVLVLDFSGPYDERLGQAEEVLEATGHGIPAVKMNHHLLRRRFIVAEVAFA